MLELDDIIEKLKKAFEKDEIKKAILEDEWYLKNINSGIHSTGFCYAASQVIYCLNGGSKTWKKISISFDRWNLGGHCYLINKDSSNILDITSDQYTDLGITIPYNLGKTSPFHKVHPNTKANILAKMAGLPALI